MRQHFIEVDESELGRPHLRKGNPVYQGVMPPSTAQPGVPLISLDIKKQDLYTFFQVAVATQLKKQVIFQQGQGGNYTPIGGTGFQLTELHTNLLVGASGGLANPQRFMAQGIARYTSEDISPVDLLNWNRITLVSFHIGDNKKSYFDGQLMTIPQPSALQIQGGTYTAATGQPASFATTGWPVTHNYIGLQTDGLLDPDTGQLIHDPGVTLDQGQYFDLSLDPTLGTGSFGAVWTTLAAASAGFGIASYFHLVGALGVSVQ